MERFQGIDEKIKDGYELIQSKDSLGGCKKWLEAWDEIKELFADGVAEDIFDLNDKYQWALPISNYAQFLEMELHNAGVDDEVYHQKRITYCRELVQWCKDELTVNNTRCGMAEAYFEAGDTASGEQVFIEWQRDDPDCDMLYVGWADCYRFSNVDNKYEKAEEILLSGYARTGLRDRINVVNSLILVYEEQGKSDKAKEYKKTLSLLQRVVKIGRNDPCPCGSGKKYKKCCGV